MINIIGERINLRTWTRDEYHSFYKSYVADPIMDPDTYVYNSERVDKSYDVIMSKASWYPRLGIFLKDDTVIGELSIKRIDYEKSQCELGIALVNDLYKSNGYGTEAIKLSIDYIFKTIKVNKIYSDTMGSNIRMQKIFEKLNFKFIAKVEHCYDMHDRWEDKLDYVLEINDYK